MLMYQKSNLELYLLCNSGNGSKKCPICVIGADVTLKQQLLLVAAVRKIYQYTRTVNQKLLPALIKMPSNIKDDFESDNDLIEDLIREVESSDSEIDNIVSCESSSECEKEKEPLNQRLVRWSTKITIVKWHLNDLLGILRDEGLQLPKDARTLLQTPKTVVSEDKCGGKYIYYGLKIGLVKIISKVTVTGTIELNINIDGVPLFKSSGKQFWPILCNFGDFTPFIVALYFGNSKPNNLNDFLFDFLNEAHELIQEGISFENNTFQVVIRAFICDAPARAFLKQIKGHTGYFACERCVIKGYWMNNRIIFHSPGPCPPRTDDEFARRIYADHQVSEMPLVNFGFSCVKSFCLDYMHLVCLGSC